MLRVVAFSLLLLMGGCTASIGTLFIDRAIYSQAQLKSVPMGWPFIFVHQDLSGYTPMSWPQSFSFVQLQDNPVSVHLGWFAADVLTFSAAIGIVGLLSVRLLRMAASGHRQQTGTSRRP